MDFVQMALGVVWHGAYQGMLTQRLLAAAEEMLGEVAQET